MIATDNGGLVGLFRDPDGDNDDGFKIAQYDSENTLIAEDQFSPADDLADEG